jgi:hypothetical protein
MQPYFLSAFAQTDVIGKIAFPFQLCFETILATLERLPMGVNHREEIFSRSINWLSRNFASIEAKRALTCMIGPALASS